MKYKMTVLYYSKAGNAEALARAIAREQQTKGDQIPLSLSVLYCAE